MLLRVSEIRHDGLVLVAQDAASMSYWLPCTEVDETVPSWGAFRDAVEPGMAVGVAEVQGQFGPGGERLQIVNMRGAEARRICDAWKGEVHGLKIESLSKTLILGRVGPVKAVMRREDYMEFLNQFPRDEHIQDHGALAVGDVICGLFRAEQGPLEDVELSFRDALDALGRRTEEAINPRLKSAAKPNGQDTEEPGKPRGPLFHTQPELLSPVLFVENDDFCRGTYCEILADAGIKVVACSNQEEAAAAIAKPENSFRMAVVDIHLTPSSSDFLGLDLAGALLRQQPDCRVVMTSAGASGDDPERKKKAWGDLLVHGYIEKPVLLDEWAAAIDAAASAQEPSPLRNFFPGGKAKAPAAYPNASGDGRNHALTLADALTSFHQKAPGVTAHVFRVHCRSWRGRSLAGVGARLNWEPFRGKLGKSVIKDAADAAQPIIENSVGDDWRHKWTKQMTSYRSFWGQRLPLPGPYRFVLVAFHPEPGFFTTERQLLAQCCAERITRVLSSQQLQRRGIHDAEQLSAGLGFACLAHEIYGRLSAVAMAVETMRGLLSCSEPVLDEAAAVAIRNKIERLGKYLPDLVVDARILRGPAGGDKPVSVAFCLEKAVAGVREAGQGLLKRPDNVDVELNPFDTKRVWLARANAGALVTVFFNVLLNAAQQIEMHSRVRLKGTVRASLQHYRDKAALPWALVFITDSGPGIHPDDWERVFDAGYTTKEDGTGLGLHICRRLLAHIRDSGREASIRIVRSILWGGTTVGIRVPLSTAPENGV